MAGMIWALSSHYFPLAYLALGPALRVLDVRMEEAGLVSGGRYLQVLPHHPAAAAAGDPLGAAAAVHARHGVLRGAAADRPAGAHRRVHHRDPGRHHPTPPEFGVASALSLTLLAICVVAVFFYRRATRHAEAFATITGKGYMPTRIKLGRWRWPVAVGVGAHVRARARPAAADAGLAVVLPQSGAAVLASSAPVHAGELRLHPALSDLSRRR